MQKLNLGIGIQLVHQERIFRRIVLEQHGKINKKILLIISADTWLSLLV
jgi:hypothetical protein